ncbi:MAG TPA: hypothetical protein VGN34_02820 [Ktedonobacteraceae bacterium]
MMDTDYVPSVHPMLQRQFDNASANRWKFVTFHHGVYMHSPRIFDTIEDALAAVVQKLAQHALDHEYPMVSLIRVQCPVGLHEVT